MIWKPVRREEYRARVAQEILCTEQSYFYNLQLLQEVVYLLSVDAVGSIAVADLLHNKHYRAVDLATAITKSIRPSDSTTQTNPRSLAGDHWRMSSVCSMPTAWPNNHDRYTVCLLCLFSTAANCLQPYKHEYKNGVPHSGWAMSLYVSVTL
jgi:hypothetical protein